MLPCFFRKSNKRCANVSRFLSSRSSFYFFFITLYADSEHVVKLVFDMKSSWTEKLAFWNSLYISWKLILPKKDFSLFADFTAHPKNCRLWCLLPQKWSQFRHKRTKLHVIGNEKNPVKPPERWQLTELS